MLTETLTQIDAEGWLAAEIARWDGDGHWGDVAYIPERARWQLYEQAKAMILPCAPAEYEQAVRALAEMLDL